ncbi:MAG TPA: hypothetical protein VIH67_13530 [Candidatus Acidoferrum sp.]
MWYTSAQQVRWVPLPSRSRIHPTSATSGAAAASKIIRHPLAQLIWIALARMGGFDNFPCDYFIDSILAI